MNPVEVAWKAVAALIVMLPGALGLQVQAGESLMAAPVTAPPTFDTNRFRPIILDAFLARTFSSYKPTESWGLVPRGLQIYAGMPFQMTGQLAVTGLGPARDRNFHPTRIGQIRINQRLARLHVIHGAAYDAPDETPLAEFRLNYTNGHWRNIFVRYGVHARNWYVEKSERRGAVSDPRSLVVWNGNSRADGQGTPTRLHKSTFDNPLPSEPVASIELLSLFSRANTVLVAITLEEPGPRESLRDQPDVENDDSEFRREMLLRTFDAANNQAVSNVVVELTVSENGRQYGFGKYRSSRHGQILLDYPPGKFEELTFRVNDTVHPTFVTGVTNEEGVFPAEHTILLPAAKKAP